MKTKLWLAALAGVALVSCVNDESLSNEDKQMLMTFDSPVLKTQSRAEVKGEIDGTSYPQDEDFMVYAYSYTGNFSGQLVPMSNLILT